MADVVFQFDVNYQDTIDKKLSNMSAEVDQKFVDETKIHIRDEFSTFDWILEGMFERVGFEIIASNKEDMILTEYVNKKVKLI